MHPPWEDDVSGFEHMSLTVRKGVQCPKKIKLQPPLLDSDTITADEGFSGEGYILKKVNKNVSELSARMRYKVKESVQISTTEWSHGKNMVLLLSRRS